MGAGKWSVSLRRWEKPTEECEGASQESKARSSGIVPNAQMWQQEVTEDFWVEHWHDHICALEFLYARHSLQVREWVGKDNNLWDFYCFLQFPVEDIDVTPFLHSLPSPHSPNFLTTMQSIPAQHLEVNRGWSGVQHPSPHPKAMPEGWEVARALFPGRWPQNTGVLWR